MTPLTRAAAGGAGPAVERQQPQGGGAGGTGGVGGAAGRPPSGHDDALLRYLRASCNEPASQKQARQRGFATLSRVFKEWSRDDTSQVLLAGSVALSAHLPQADTDVVCVTSGPRRDFFATFAEHLRGVQGVTSAVTIASAMPPIIQACIFGVRHDILFCTVPQRVPLPSPIDVSDDAWLRGMDVASRRSLGGTRLAILIRRCVLRFPAFRQALQLIKLWGVRRGVSGAKFGFPGGVTWVAMVVAAVATAGRARGGSSAGAAAAPTPLCIVSAFFRLFDGEAGLRSPLALLGLPHSWRKGPEDHMAVLVPVPSPPGAPLQMINTCPGSGCTVSSLAAEISRAASLCRSGRMHCVWNPADFFASYPRFLQVETRATTTDLLDRWAGYVESRMRDLLKLLDCWAATSSSSNTATAAPPELRPYPYTFRSDRPSDRADRTIPPGCAGGAARPGDCAGYIFVGVLTAADAFPTTDPSAAVSEGEDLAAAVEGFAEECLEWGDRVGGMFRPAITAVTRSGLPRFALDTAAAAAATTPDIPHPTTPTPTPHEADAVMRRFGESGLPDPSHPHTLREVTEDAPLLPLWGIGPPESTLRPGELVVAHALGDPDAGGGGGGGGNTPPPPPPPLAWIRTEDGREGLAPQDCLREYAVAAAKPPAGAPPHRGGQPDGVHQEGRWWWWRRRGGRPEPPPYPPSPGSCAAAAKPPTGARLAQTRGGDARLLPAPFPEACLWGGGADTTTTTTTLAEGQLVAILGVDDSRQFALVSTSAGVTGYTRVRHLPAEGMGGVPALEAERLFHAAACGAAAHGVFCAGVLSQLEEVILEAAAQRLELSVHRFAGRSYALAGGGACAGRRHFHTCGEPEVWKEGAVGGAVPPQPPPAAVCSVVELTEASRARLLGAFRERGLVPVGWTALCHAVFLKPGPLNDSLTEGQEVALRVVAVGASASGVAAGVVGCGVYTLNPVPHVLVAASSLGAASYTTLPCLRGAKAVRRQGPPGGGGAVGQGRGAEGEEEAGGYPQGTWGFLPDSECVEVFGTVCECTEADLASHILCDEGGCG